MNRMIDSRMTQAAGASERRVRADGGGFFHDLQDWPGILDSPGHRRGARLLIADRCRQLHLQSTPAPTGVLDRAAANNAAAAGHRRSALVAASVGAAGRGGVINKPTNVDFLIATDSEMKKVNWTSRRS